MLGTAASAVHAPDADASVRDQPAFLAERFFFFEARFVEG
jgi:hypothetical protein